MDVGTIVESSGLYASVFALLACIALAVELGRRPPKPKRMFVDDEEISDTPDPPMVETKSDTKSDSKAATKASVEIPSRAFGSPVLQQTSVETPGIPEIPFDQLQPTVVGAFDFAAERKAALAQDNLLTLQRTYVDGLLSPRGKYDVALAILNEYQVSSTMAVSENAGQTMATEAYLSATRTGTIESERAPFLAGLMKSIMTPPAESTADDTNNKQASVQEKSTIQAAKSEKVKADKTKLDEKPRSPARPGGAQSPPKEKNTTERRKPSSNRMRNRNTNND